MIKRAETLSQSFVVWLLRVTIICLFAPMVQSLYADGKYFPEKAYKIPPDIPTQRAIIVYKNGFEKLTIESALNGQGQEFGWIIPLPSKPLQFEKTSPGLIKTLALTLQPKIIHDLGRLIPPFCAITVIITLGCVMSVTKTPKKRINRLLLLLLITLILSCLFTPTMGAVRTVGIKTGDILGVTVHQIQEIGSYQLFTLEADETGALDKWLTSNGFAGLTDKDIPVISDYIKDGWFFVAAKLRREGDGYSRPHPLTMSFASKVPIYPIRLTSTLGNDLYLELFAIAERQAKCNRLILEVSDEYNYFEDEIGNSDFKKFYLPGFIGRTYQQNIGHPDAKGQMWSGCIISKLSGTLTSYDMAEDIVLELEEAEPYQKYYFSYGGASESGFIVSLITWGLLFVVLTAYFGSKNKEENKWKVLFKITLCALLVSLFIGRITYAVLPKVNVQTESLRSWIVSHSRLVQESFDVFEKYKIFDDLNFDETKNFIGDYFSSKYTNNMYTGEKIKHEDSPGNYTIFEDERGTVLRTYSRGGYPDDYVLKSKPPDTE